jgi:hypothetical protein
VSGSRASKLLLRLYPPGWRARYGEELEDLIAASSNGRRVPLRTAFDVALAAGRERVRTIAGGPHPGERIRAGSLLVLCAWALFVVAGLGVAKFSEHWQVTTPVADRGLPAGAFWALRITAGIGSLLVLAGILATLPSLVRMLRTGGWPAVRRPVVTAALLSSVTAAATIGLVSWAHVLTIQQRNGRELLYAIAFVAWALLVASSIGAWTVAAVATARQLALSRATLRLDTWLASGVTVAMGVMTAATLTWWAASAQAGVPPLLVGCVTLMIVGTLLGAIGTTRALRALPALTD